MSSRNELRLDWCGQDAATYAVRHWHYSGRVPKGKIAKIGVWESGQFIGCVIFGDGANNNAFKPYGVDYTGGCELVRIALREHQASVTRIVAIALRMLKREMPKLRVVLSFADTEQGHIGGIYQGGGWFYIGQTTAADEYICNGRRIHGRALRSSLKWKGTQGKDTMEKAAKAYGNVEKLKGSVKLRYAMPLDGEMRKLLEGMRQPYPKRAGSGTIDTSANHAEKGGAIPTPALQSHA